MAKYRYELYVSELWGDTYYALEKWNWFWQEWVEQKTWTVSKNHKYTQAQKEKVLKQVMESVDRLVKAGHTVI